MKKCFAFAALACVLALVSMSVAADDPSLKSGPQVGGKARPKPFFPLNLNGPTADQKQCLVCRNGNNPVAMIFAREPNSQLTNLFKQLDEATVKNKDKKMGSFVVFCNDSESTQKDIKELVKKEGFKAFVVSLDNPAGPDSYNIAKDADITVVLYNKSKVEANYAFRKGQMTDADVAKIVSNLDKILK